MSHPNLSAGFSAIELLITLFVGAAFIGAGYQLYSISLKDGNDARLRAQASSIAYSNLRTASPKATNPCSAQSFSGTVPANSGLTNPTASIGITCPYGTSSSVSKISVTLTYGSGSQLEVTHALYVSAQ